MKSKHSEYKQRNMKIWNEIAPRYHKRWASVNKGPFQSTAKLIELVNIKKGNTVLDLACGTGVVTKKIQNKVGTLGYVVPAAPSPSPTAVYTDRCSRPRSSTRPSRAY